MAQRLEQISGHLSNIHSRGLLAGEVAIITGKFCRFGGVRGSSRDVHTLGAAQVD